ncbi:MAG: 30S ribosomal protein S16 [Deltaproteobacteria bacterium]
MAVKMRLSRAGVKKAPFYHVVVADERMPRDGRFIEEVGSYDPTIEPPVVKLNHPRIEHWISKGAQTSAAVGDLIRRAKSVAPAK